MDKKWKFLIAILILGMCGITRAYPSEARFYIYKYLGPRDFEEKTRPLDDETQEYLCDLFNISFRGLCDPSQTVYSVDFYLPLDDYVWAGNLQTHEEWDEELGRFLEKCVHSKTFINSDGSTYYRCSYDFAGDGIFHIALFFNEDGSLDKHVHGD